MTSNYASFVTRLCAVAFLSFLAVHYAHMKSPGQHREIASQMPTVVYPMYDASFKL